MCCEYLRRLNTSLMESRREDSNWKKGTLVMAQLPPGSACLLEIAISREHRIHTSWFSTLIILFTTGLGPLVLQGRWFEFILNFQCKYRDQYFAVSLMDKSIQSIKLILLLHAETIALNWHKHLKSRNMAACYRYFNKS